MKRNLILSSVLVVAALLLAGCVHSSYGTKMDGVQINEKIKDGVTTSEQVMVMCGAPMASSLTPDGRKMMTYIYTEVNGRPKNIGLAFVPIVGGMLVGAQGEQQRQHLQVIVGANGVVERHLFTDSTSRIERNGFYSTMTPVSASAAGSSPPAVISERSQEVSMVSTNR